MIRYLTAGESHGKALTVIIDGLPAGLSITKQEIEAELKKRKQGYGRGGRQKIETDEIEILSGIRYGKTIGSPVTVVIHNKDHENWKDIMSAEGKAPADYIPLTVPRPGHADYAGMIKYGFDDIRNILERSSARETAVRVAAGSFALKILEQLGIVVTGYVDSIGSVSVAKKDLSLTKINEAIKESELFTIDKEAEKQMKLLIDKASIAGVSLGGTFVIVAEGLPIGLGSYTHWDKKLDANLAKAIISIQAIKGVEFGLGFELSKQTGDKAHDEFAIKNDEITRKTNRSGGLEGGMTNGEPVVIRVAMKPIPTMKNVLNSVDLKTKKSQETFFERADVCAVPAAMIVARSVVAIELVNAILEKFGGDSLQELKARIHK